MRHGVAEEVRRSALLLASSKCGISHDTPLLRFTFAQEGPRWICTLLHEGEVNLRFRRARGTDFPPRIFCTRERRTRTHRNADHLSFRSTRVCFLVSKETSEPESNAELRSLRHGKLVSIPAGHIRRGFSADTQAVLACSKRLDVTFRTTAEAQRLRVDARPSKHLSPCSRKRSAVNVGAAYHVTT